MRLLRPISSGDDDDEDDVSLDSVDLGAAEGGLKASTLDLRRGDADYDARNRKWRARMERALVQLAAEVAALREGVEARRGWSEVLGGGRRRRGWWAFVAWLVGAVVRHVLVDVLLGVGVVAWVRRRRLRQGWEEWVRAVRSRVREGG